MPNGQSRSRSRSRSRPASSNHAETAAIPPFVKAKAKAAPRIPRSPLEDWQEQELKEAAWQSAVMVARMATQTLRDPSDIEEIVDGFRVGLIQTLGTRGRLHQDGLELPS